MLDTSLCRQRQQRALRLLESDSATRSLDAIVVGQPHHVYYLSGYLPNWLQQAALVLRRDGSSHLICAQRAGAYAADRIEQVRSSVEGTQRQDQSELVAERVVAQLGHGSVSSVGMDLSPTTAMVALSGVAAVNIEPLLCRARRKKYADELELMKRAIACCKAMYDRARQIIEPGIPELRVYNELHTAAVLAGGGPLNPAKLGNDFACGVGGGSPRLDRLAQAGQLYILDIGPGYGGYFSDNCRAFAVDRRPTDVQLKTWSAVVGVFPVIEATAKPGVRCHDLYAAADAQLRAHLDIGMTHHLGHGIGLFPHEAPHLNLHWDDILEEGDVFTVEPGVYGPHLGGGMRIENQYLVTATGVVNLTPAADFPLELA